MNETDNIQERIEKTVTNGLGYETTPIVMFPCPVLQNHYQKNTREGLQIHLAEMDNKIKPSSELSNIIAQYKVLAASMDKYEASSGAGPYASTFMNLKPFRVAEQTDVFRLGFNYTPNVPNTPEEQARLDNILQLVLETRYLPKEFIALPKTSMGNKYPEQLKQSEGSILEEQFSAITGEKDDPLGNYNVHILPPTPPIYSIPSYNEPKWSIERQPHQATNKPNVDQDEYSLSGEGDLIPEFITNVSLDSLDGKTLHYYTIRKQAELALKKGEKYDQDKE